MSAPGLGFLVFVSHDRPADAARSLEQGIDLFRAAERLGYGSGWVRVRRHSPTLSAPFPFLSAVARETNAIRLGTGVLPVGFEDTLRLAEDAATTDLLSGGRLELGVSSGHGAVDAPVGADREAVVSGRLAALRDAIAGRPLGEPYASRFAADPFVAREQATAGSAGTTPTDVAAASGWTDPQPRPSGAVAQPISAGLSSRLWYGSGTLSSALRAARLGYDLLLSTLNGEFVPGTLGENQARQIAAYRDEFARQHPDRTPRVAISRSILPLVGAEDRARFGGYVERYRGLVDAEGRFAGTPPTTQWSPLYGGEPESIAEEIAADPSVALADDVLLTPITELDLPTLHRVLETVAVDVAPLLGWRTPAGAIA
ncbi:LLM class flavin-dependent oxidoreductase [Galbitalea sp. SE-J8]|uniref:LLM class flavin-dependent oxidoreductase n=1 Tax=Galbitalea sp. SE-J8 TaxID=3054952 RepID=UPI00259CCCEF|nr:LLM class flavin-dependent oxidoreductase [Galbitalea sp. SE-J8]MDM4761617.1 LLM class flavin-dependent oxidoreductase [Galbitalea sp. SE-J8]